MTPAGWVPVPAAGVTALGAMAAACGVLAGWRAAQRCATRARARRLHGDATPRLPGPWRRGGRRAAALLRGAAGGAGWQWAAPAAGALLAWWGRSPLPLLAGCLALPWVRRRLRAAARRREAERLEAAVVELCTFVAGEVRAGLPPEQALLAAEGCGLRAAGPAVSAAARYGGDVPAALRSAAARPGAEGLRGVAACWQVAREGGSTLADGLERVAAALNAERDQRAEVHAQLAGPRATAAVLTLLPLFGLLLGTAMGVAPLRVLLHTPAGLACLAAGCALEAAGLAWVTRLVRGAEQPGLHHRAVPHG